MEVEKLLGRVHHSDCIEFMCKLPGGCVDLIVTSPPYNLLNSTGGGMKNVGGHWANSELRNGYDQHEDNMPHEQYVDWQRECLSEMLRIIPENGAIFYNHKWRVQNRVLQQCDDIVSGFPVRQIIIWQRSGGINFNKYYYLPTYEVIYLIAKNDFELKRKYVGLGDVWKFNQESKKNKHPAPFPIDLPKRCVISTNAKVVFDPFSGSGTTGLACEELGVDWFGCDNSNKYVEMSNDRIQKNRLQVKLKL